MGSVRLPFVPITDGKVKIINTSIECFCKKLLRGGEDFLFLYVRVNIHFHIHGVLPTKRRYYTLRKLQTKKVEFLYVKEPTFLVWLVALTHPFVI